MKNVVIEVLDKEHGKKVIEYFKSQGCDVGKYEGTCTKKDGNNCRFYGIDNITNKIYNYTFEQVIRLNLSIITLPEISIDNSLFKTKEIDVKGIKRNITISIIVTNSKINAGYSVCLPTDTVQHELGEKIATGRALKEKTNLTLGMELGKGMNKKYILHAIADNLFLQIERGVIVIKGIK